MSDVGLAMLITKWIFDGLLWLANNLFGQGKIEEAKDEEVNL